VFQDDDTPFQLVHYFGIVRREYNRRSIAIDFFEQPDDVPAVFRV
jgi:hypothetical protein